MRTKALTPSNAQIPTFIYVLNAGSEMDNDGVQPDLYAKASINNHTALMLWPIALMLIDLYFTQTALLFHSTAA